MSKYEEMHLEMNGGGRFFRRDYEGEHYQYLWDLNKLPSRVDRVLKVAELITWAKDNNYNVRLVEDRRPTALQYSVKYKQPLEVVYLDPVPETVDTELSNASTTTNNQEEI